jgi:hypothetical protein
MCQRFDVTGNLKNFAKFSGNYTGPEADFAMMHFGRSPEDASTTTDACMHAQLLIQSYKVFAFKL